MFLDFTLGVSTWPAKVIRKDGDDVVNIEFVKGNIEKIIEILKTNKHLFLDRDIQLGVEYVNDQIKTKKRNFQLSKSRIKTLFGNIGINIEWGLKGNFSNRIQQITKWRNTQEAPTKKKANKTNSVFIVGPIGRIGPN